MEDDEDRELLLCLEFDPPEDEEDDFDRLELEDPECDVVELREFGDGDAEGGRGDAPDACDETGGNEGELNTTDEGGED